MRKIKNILHLLVYNAKTFLIFELLYKLLGVTVAIPALYGAFDLMMLVSGYRYLTMENIRKFIKHPLLFVFLLLALLAIGLYSFFDFSVVIYVIHCSKNEEKTNMEETLRFARQNLFSILKKSNRRMFWIILLFVLYCCIGQIPEIASSLAAPNVLLMASKQLRKRALYLMAALILGFILYVRNVFSLHYFSLEPGNGKESMKKSQRLHREGRVRTVFWLLITQAVLYAVYVLYAAIGILLVVVFGRLFAKARIVSSITVSFAQILITVLLVVFSLLGVPVNAVVQSLLFYRYKEQIGEPVTSIEEVKVLKKCRVNARREQWRAEHRKFNAFVSALIFSITSVACVFYVYQMHRGEWNRNVEYLKTMEVTAHRGASYEYPENTMAAFQGALENGADWIELDIRESRDHQLFVMHDRSFYRTTGVNANAWDLTYEEISELDAGIMFGSEFAGEKIPLLSEVIDFAKENGIRLNIEIKPSSYEEDMEELLVELIQEKEFTERCVVTSQTYDSIRQVKQLDENITTVYVMSLAYGDINRMKYADAFSVRASSISNALVSKVHNSGKQIYAWTVNNRDTINLMISRKVDNIITDDVLLAKKCIGQRINSNVVNDYISLLNRSIRYGNFLFQ